MKIMRTSATLLAASLAVAGTAASASAATAHTASTTDLIVKITQGSASVAGGDSVEFKGTYTCNDTAGAHNVAIAVVLDQGNANGGHEATVNVPCQVTNGAWSVTVPFSGVKTGTEIDAQATIDDNDLQATAQARLIEHTAFVTVNPTETVNSDGSITISGTYGCSDTETADIIASINRIQTGGAASIGVAAVTANCPATNATWTAKATLASMPTSSTGTLEQSFDATWGDGHARILSSGEMIAPQS